MSNDDGIIDAQVKELKSRYLCFRVWTAVGGILLLVVLGYVLNVLSIPVGIIIWSTIIVFCLRTPVNRLEKRGVNRMIGTTIAYAGMFLVIAGFAALLFSPVFGVGEQFMDLAESIPGYVQQLTDWYNQLYSQYSVFFQNDTIKNWIDEATAAFGMWTSQIAKDSADGVIAIGGIFASSFMVMGFSLVVAFWMLMELPAFCREVRRLIAGKYERDAQMLYITFTRVMGGYIKATFVQCLLIGLGCGVAYAIIGIPNAVALGGIAGLLNIIPVVGPWLGGGLAAVVGVFASPLSAIIALAVTIAIQQFIYTFVSPKLMADSVDVHPALVIIALLAGSAIGGAMNGLMGSLVGMLASIPAVAAMKAIFVYYFEKNTGRRIVAEDGVFFKGVPGAFSDTGFNYIVDAASPSRTERGPSQGEKEPVEKLPGFFSRFMKVSDSDLSDEDDASDSESDEDAGDREDQARAASKRKDTCRLARGLPEKEDQARAASEQKDASSKKG